MFLKTSTLFFNFVVCWSAVIAQQTITQHTQFFGGTSQSSNAAYNTWFQSHGSFYNQSVFVPVLSNSSDGAAVHWSIIDDRIYLAVAARATGWVGFGLAEAGGMRGADVVYYTASTNELVDAYVLSDYMSGPQPDTCQNWELRNAQSDGGFVIFEAVRDLNTGDPQDRPIINDINPGEVPAHRIIAAWGDTPQISYHGLTGRVKSAIRFYGAPNAATLFYQTMKEQADGSFVVRAMDYTIPQQDTEYKKFCFSQDALVNLGAVNQSIHVIGWEPIVSNASAPYVHHFLIYGSQNANQGLPYNGTVCDSAPAYEVGYGT